MSGPADNRPQDSLRQRAEEALSRSTADIERLPRKDLQTLVHELQVHQIELKMQNEELRNTQLQLQSSRDSYTELYEFAPIGYLTTNGEGIIQTANLIAITLFGLDRSALVGSKVARHVAAEDQNTLHHLWKKLRESKEKQTFELRVLNQGRPIWTQVEASVRESNPDELLVTLSDISLRKQSEEELQDLNQTLERRVMERSEQLLQERNALRLSEERLTLALRASRDAIWDWDLTSGTVWRNESYDKLFGEPPSTVDFPQWWEEHIHPDDRTRVANALKAAVSSDPDYGDLWEEEYRFQRRDGSFAYVVDQGFLSRNSEGRATRIIGTMKDISSRVDAEEKRLEAERLAAIGEAMTGLVHESRNALNRTVSALRMIERRTKDKPDLDEFIDGAREALLDVQNLFEEVRSYAAPVKLDSQPCNLVELVDKTWERLLLVRDKREARVTHCGETDLECHACDVTLSRVFRNIFENALAACKDPVDIKIRYSPTELHGKSAIRVAISDNGPGLTPEVRAQVFDAFYTTRTHGTGLGMAISKRIVEAHGGTIGVAAPNGSGAEFIITLPNDK